MSIHLGNGDIVLMIALALLGTLVVAIRFRPRNVFILFIEALLVDALAVLAVVALEIVPVLLT
jgi:hypothetical protein